MYGMKGRDSHSVKSHTSKQGARGLKGTGVGTMIRKLRYSGELLVVYKLYASYRYVHLFMGFLRWYKTVKHAYLVGTSSVRWT